MEQKRNRTLRNGVGLLTALTLSVGLLAGCGPKFDTSPGATRPPAAGANASALPADAVTIAGTAALSSGPLAGATIKVVDVLTGRELPMVAGGANIVAGGAGNIIAGGAGNLTDSTGNFSVSVTGLTAGSVARVVAAGSGGAMSALVGGDGVSASSKYALNAFIVPRIVINAGSTAADRAIAPLFLMTAKLRPSARLAIVRVLMERGGALAQSLSNYYATNPTQAAALFTSTNPTTGIADATQVNLAITASGNIEEVQTAATDAANGVAGAPLSSLANLDELPSQTLTPIAGVAFTANGDLSIGGVIVNLPEPQTAEQNPTPAAPNPGTPTNPNPGTGGEQAPTTDGSGGADDDIDEDFDPDATGDEGAIITSAAFNPTVNLDFDGTNLEVNVSQPSGAQDIGRIVARLAKADGADFTGSNVPGSIGTGMADLDSFGPLVDRTLTIVQDTDATPGMTLPARFGGTDLGASQMLWQGFIRSTTQQEDIATFHVYETDLYLYLVTTYNLDPSFSLLSNGHNTTLSTTTVDVNDGAKGEIVMTSREGERVERTDLLTGGI